MEDISGNFTRKNIVFALLSSEAVDAMSQAIDEYFQSAAPHRPPRLDNPKKGAFGCAIFADDGQLYRCR